MNYDQPPQLETMTCPSIDCPTWQTAACNPSRKCTPQFCPSPALANQRAQQPNTQCFGGHSTRWHKGTTSFVASNERYLGWVKIVGTYKSQVHGSMVNQRGTPCALGLKALRARLLGTLENVLEPLQDLAFPLHRLSISHPLNIRVVVDQSQGAVVKLCKLQCKMLNTYKAM